MGYDVEEDSFVGVRMIMIRFLVYHGLTCLNNSFNRWSTFLRCVEHRIPRECPQETGVDFVWSFEKRWKLLLLLFDADVGERTAVRHH